MPSPHDLALALKAYTADLERNDKLFPLRATSGSIVNSLRRDLTGAGVPWERPTGKRSRTCPVSTLLPITESEPQMDAGGHRSGRNRQV